MIDSSKYTDKGAMMTGFSNGIDRSFYGHWSNPEYQQHEQLDEFALRQIRIDNDSTSLDYNMSYPDE